MSQLPPEEADLGLAVDEEPAPRPAPRHARPEGSEQGRAAEGSERSAAQADPPEPDHLVSPDDPEDPARSPRTLGIDNTDTALGAEDDSAPVE